MDASLIVSIILALIGISGTIYTGWKAGETTLEKTNYDNAKSIYEQYQQLNADLKQEIKNNEEKNKAFAKEIEELRGMITDMQTKFREREVFWEREVELRDDRIEELEFIIIEKDKVITELEKGTMT